jgi:L-ascorbate metabolism protein UlaG (beta-lactamase superfamily)
MRIPALQLGQSGFRLVFGDAVVYVDPYLSDSVAECCGPRFRRRVPAPFAPEQVRDADLVLITHAHLDHCDPGTLPGLAKASPGCLFLAPREVGRELERMDVEPRRIVEPELHWIPVEPGLRVRPVPAAHPEPELDEDGHHRFFGFVIEYAGRRIYHAGDTSAHELLISELRELAPIDVALLPVNERNFFRARMDIVGNMSVREAFGLAEEIGARQVVPMHWDMFEPNSVLPEEIELLYARLRPRFELRLRVESL